MIRTPYLFDFSTLKTSQLPFKSQVIIDIYDILGRKVVSLIDKQQPAGFHQMLWDAENFASGAYFYKLQAGDYIDTKKMMLVK